MNTPKIGRRPGSVSNLEGLRRLKATPKESLAALYLSGKTTAEIGTIYKVSRTAVDNRMKALGIARRWHDETPEFRNAKMTIPLSNDQKHLLLGSLLGDACLHEYSKDTKRFGTRKYLKVQFAQGVAQLPYLSHKRDIMLEGRQNLPVSCVSKLGQRPEGSNLGEPVWQFAFSHTPTLRIFSKEFDMKDSASVTSVSAKWVAGLTEHSVAYWFADDGCLLSYPVNGAWRFTLHTDSFSTEELEKLLAFIREFCAPSARLIEKREGQFAIQSDRKAEVEEFRKLIAPYTPKCMFHKLKYE